MKKYNIITGEMFTDLDTPYDKDNNKIDVYSSVYWSADSKEEYKEKEDIINNWKLDNSLVSCFAWCDISGFDYWVIEQQEENYVSIDVCLKKPANEYTQDELIRIRELIIEADRYFEDKLN